MKFKTILFLSLAVVSFSCTKKLQIVIPENAGQLEKLAAGEISGTMNWKPLGAIEYQSISLTRMDRNVFEATIPAGAVSEDFEYYISVHTGNNELVYPATAKNIHKTVVIL